MKSKYEVTFADDSVERVEADNADQAKAQARAKRADALDPGRSRLRADVFSNASVKVKQVAEVTAAILLSILAWGPLFGFHLIAAVLGDGLDGYQSAGVLQLVGASGTAIGATLASLAAVTGDSLQVPAFERNKPGWLLNWWTDVQVAGTARIRSSAWHDNVNGHRIDTVIGQTIPNWPHGVKQVLGPGDMLSVELAGSAVAGDVEYVVMLQYFEELFGQRLNGLTWEQLQQRATGNLLTIENTIATGATPVWAGGEAINAEIDQFKAKTSYALIGYLCDAECAAIAWRGPDTGGLRVGGPGNETERDLTRGWFLDLARAYGLPLIPVIQADNKAATFIDALQDENGADTTVTSLLMELKPQ